ncbi:MAG: hypothetical protein KF897_10895 [Opitutaceae bacterium]|nr:hypothetical protein [Opitutaceae bacterium]
MKTTPQRLTCVTLTALLLAPFAVAQSVQAGGAVRGAASRPALPPAASVRAEAAAKVETTPETQP